MTAQVAEESAEITPHASLNDALAYLVSYKVRCFYARVANSLEKMPTYNIPTLAVAPKNGRYALWYNPDCVKHLTYDALLIAIEHEIMHVILGHIPRFIRLKKVMLGQYSKALFEITYNLSMDLADNELLRQNYNQMGPKAEGFLGGLLYPENWKPHLPRNLDYESYQKILLEELNKKLQSPPNKIYEVAQELIRREEQQRQQQQQQQQQQGQGQDQKQQENQGGSKGQEQEQSQDGQQQGEGSGQSQEQEDGQSGGGSSMSDQELEDALKDMNPVDRQVLDMFMRAQRSHKYWDQGNEGDETDAHKLDGHGRQIIKDAVDSHKKCRGTIPSHIEELIRQMLMPPTVPWTQFLHDIVIRTQQTRKERGMARPSKVLSALVKKAQLWENEDEKTKIAKIINRIRCLKRTSVFPGIKQERKFTILYAIDTSGSMSTDELQKCTSELQHIQKSDPEIKIIVIYADADINKIYEIGPHDELDYGMGGRGGTDFEPVFEKTADMMRAFDKAPDILVYATDGCAPPPTTVLPIPCVWLITPGNQPPCKDAGHIVLEMKDYQLGESYL